MNQKGWNDIGYNFVVGEDGNVYEGRGWGTHGAHSTSYNSKSIGICIIGNFVGKLRRVSLYALRNAMRMQTQTLIKPPRWRE